MKKQGKKKATVSDQHNQRKITSFFKKSDSDNKNDGNSNGIGPTSTSRSLFSRNTPNKNQTCTAKAIKKIEVIVISESSSDSDFLPVERKRSPINVTEPVASLLTDNTDTAIKSESLVSQVLKVKNNDRSVESDDKGDTHPIKIVSMKQICDAETQLISFTDACENESSSQSSCLSPSLLNDDDVDLVEQDSLYTSEINNFLRNSSCKQQTPDPTFKNGAEQNDVDRPECHSPSLLPSDKTSENFKSELKCPQPKTPESSRKLMGLFLTPSKGPANPRTPTKSPKSVATYFSPVRHLRRPEFTSPQRLTVSNLTNRSPNEKKLNYYADPYYYKNFVTIVNTVSSDKHHAYCVSDNDRKMTDSFHSLTRQSQCLYIRLFQRKWAFKPASSIKYPLISENLSPYFQELYDAGFLEELKDEKRDLDTVLDLLNGDQMGTLSKCMGVTGKTKESYKASLLKMSQKQKTLFSSSSEIIYKEAVKLLGPTYKVSLESKSLFSRYFILHSPPQYWEDQSDQSSNQLLSVLLMDMGKMEYPAYVINKTIRIYISREELISFQEAWGLHSELNCHIESKNWTDVCTIGERCIELLQMQLSDCQVSSYNAALPSYLRVYTAGSVLTHTVWLSVQGHQKLKDYARANEVINILIAQSVYLVHYRARWFERIIVNMKHLKVPHLTVMELIKTALSDNHAQDSHKYTLTLRYTKLLEEYNKKLSKISKKKSTKKEVEVSENVNTIQPMEFESLHLYHLRHEIPSRTIEGEKFDMFDTGKGPSGFKSVFLGSKAASSVEQFAMNYYISEGYTCGVHGEGSVPVSLFGLLFWDVIYNDEIPDVFQSVFQPFPLDMNFEEFYSQRVELINEVLLNLRLNWSIEDALECIERHWNANFNKICIVNWSLFSSLEDLRNLVKSLEMNVIASICERMAKNFRHHRSGFPDLVMWDGSKCIFVEVKGPGDSLSAKQSLWIDFLVTIGAKVEVCNVKSVSNKRIRKM